MVLDLVQAAHWHHEQVTVHPIVCYYGCQFKGAQRQPQKALYSSATTVGITMTPSFKFTQLAVDHLRTVRGLEIKNIVQWTDGCGAQYKSKGPFADISCALSDFGCTFERNFFGSRSWEGSL